MIIGQELSGTNGSLSEQSYRGTKFRDEWQNFTLVHGPNKTQDLSFAQNQKY